MHVDLLRTHGGLPGVRDENALESALARPRQKCHYGRATDIATLAAAYGYGLSRNHPYRDGNRRIAFMAMAVFLGLNGKELDAAEADVVTTMVRVAGGALPESAVAKWPRAHLRTYRDD